MGCNPLVIAFISSSTKGLAKVVREMVSPMVIKMATASQQRTREFMLLGWNEKDGGMLLDKLLLR